MPIDSATRRELRTITLVGMAHGTSHFFHLMLPPLFPWLMREFSLSFTEAGALMTAFFVVSGIGQALAGFVVDRYGARRVLFAGIALLGLSGFALGLAHSHAMLVAAAALAGLGNSVFHPADFTILNRRVSQPRLGHAFSVHGLAGNLGWAAAPLFMTGIATFADWHVAGFAAGAVGFAMLALLFWQRDALATGDSVKPEAPAEAARGSALAFLGHGQVWLCFTFFVVSTVAFGALQNYSPAVLGNLYALSLATATAGLSAYLAGGACGMAIGGFLAAAGSGHDRVILYALALAALMALLLASGSPPAWSVIALMALMGLGVGVAGPSRDMLVRQAATATLGPQAYGRIYGFVYSGLDIGLATAPLVFGPLMDGGRFAAVLAGVALLQCLAIASALTVGSRARTRRKAVSAA